jgi:hypothetical protein
MAAHDATSRPDRDDGSISRRRETSAHDIRTRSPGTDRCDPPSVYGRPGDFSSTKIARTWPIVDDGKRRILTAETFDSIETDDTV